MESGVGNDREHPGPRNGEDVAGRRAPDAEPGGGGDRAAGEKRRPADHEQDRDRVEELRGASVGRHRRDRRPEPTHKEDQPGHERDERGGVGDARAVEFEQHDPEGSLDGREPRSGPELPVNKEFIRSVAAASLVTAVHSGPMTDTDTTQTGSESIAAAVDAVIDVVAATAPEIRNGLPGRRAAADGENPSGETQMAADVFADDLLCERLGAVAGVGTYASEERAEAVDVGEGVSVCVDPLDGSSNLEPNAAMGTIVAIYDDSLPAGGRDIRAAVYVLYGPITTMVVARGESVTEYVIRDGGEYDTLTEDVRLPDDPTVYGFGGRVPNWVEAFEDFAADVESDPSMKLRYGGAMIGDVNQVLTYGGIFAYPTLTTAPEGKLRLQFEGYPVGYIVEAAGGASSDGRRSLLDVEPEDLHDRTPVYVGNPELIDDLEARLAE